MFFPSRWNCCCNAYTAFDLASIATIPIGPEERLSRFVLKTKWLKPGMDGRIGYEALLP